MAFKDFRVCETLGKGSFASVYKVSVCESGCGGLKRGLNSFSDGPIRHLRDANDIALFSLLIGDS